MANNECIRRVYTFSIFSSVYGLTGGTKLLGYISSAVDFLETPPATDGVVSLRDPISDCLEPLTFVFLAAVHEFSV